MTPRARNREFREVAHRCNTYVLNSDVYEKILKPDIWRKIVSELSPCDELFSTNKLVEYSDRTRTVHAYSSEICDADVPAVGLKDIVVPAADGAGRIEKRS